MHLKKWTKSYLETKRMLFSFLSYYLYVFKYSKLNTAIFFIDITTLAIYIFKQLRMDNTNPPNLFWLCPAVCTVLYKIIMILYSRKELFDRNNFEVKDNIIPPNISNKQNNIYEMREYAITSQKTTQIHKSHILFSRDIDIFLQHGKECRKIEIVISKSKSKRVQQYIREYWKPWLHRFLYLEHKKAILFVNEQKFCMSEDLSLLKRTIECHRGGYYDSYLTNRVSMLELVNKETQIVYKCGGKESLYNLCGQIKTISATPFNNEIGISTIALTQDNYMILYQQNTWSASSAGLYVPTGSGSLDWDDYKEQQKNGGGTNFYNLIVRGMNREMCEESSLDFYKNQDKCKTMIVGYFRWIEKGGKPEFLGLTRIGVNTGYFKAARKEVIHYTSIAFTSVENFINELRCLKTDAFSLPLLRNIECILELYNRDKSTLQKFFDGQFNYCFTRCDAISRAGGDANEDAIHMTQKFLVVIDGATDLTSSETYNGFASNAQWFSYKVKKYLSEHLQAETEPIMNILHDAVCTICPIQHNINPTASIAVVRLVNDHLEYFLLGDCTIVLKRVSGGYTIISDDTLTKFDNSVLDKMISIHNAQKITIKCARNFVGQDLQKNRAKANTQGGYWVLDTEGTAIQHGKSGFISADDVSEVLVMSDGFSAVYLTYQIFKDYEALMEALVAHRISLNQLVDKMFMLQDADPDWITYPRFKFRDDASAIFASVKM